MSSKSKNRRCSDIIGVLAQRYPGTFFTEKLKIRPLRHSIIVEVLADMRPSQAEQRLLVDAIGWYRNATPYIVSVALGKHRRDIRGRRIEPCDYSARKSARQVLIGRKAWTENLQARYEQYIDGLDLLDLLK